MLSISCPWLQHLHSMLYIRPTIVFACAKIVSRQSGPFFFSWYGMLRISAFHPEREGEIFWACENVCKKALFLCTVISATEMTKKLYRFKMLHVQPQLRALCWVEKVSSLICWKLRWLSEASWIVNTIGTNMCKNWMLLFSPATNNVCSISRWYARSRSSAAVSCSSMVAISSTKMRTVMEASPMCPWNSSPRQQSPSSRCVIWRSRPPVPRVFCRRHKQHGTRFIAFECDDRREESPCAIGPLLFP